MSMGPVTIETLLGNRGLDLISSTTSRGPVPRIQKSLWQESLYAK